MAEVISYHYDTSAGALLVGEAALTDFFEAGGHPADLHPLVEVIEDPAMPIPRDIIEPLLDLAWNREDCTALGKWLLTITNPLKRDKLRRVYHMGLGPDINRYTYNDPATGEQRFESLGEFYETIQAEGTLRRGRYSHMSFTDVLAYVQETAEEAIGQGVESLRDFFIEKASRGEGPHINVMKRLTKHPLLELLDMVGYPDVRNMSNDDMIRWGVRFMFANDGAEPTTPDINLLSSRRIRRGPSETTLINHFGTIGRYQLKVLEAYRLELKRREDKLEAIAWSREHGLIPDSFFVRAKSDNSIIKRYAKWRVVESLCGEYLDWRTKQQVINSTGPSKQFEDKLLETHPNLTRADIEETADMLGVFDDIYQQEDHYSHHLRMSNYRK